MAQLIAAKQRELEAAGDDTQPEPEKESTNTGTLKSAEDMTLAELERLQQEGKMPLNIRNYADQVSEDDHELRERCLLYVACTRARDELVIAGYGRPSPFVRLD